MQPILQTHALSQPTVCWQLLQLASFLRLVADITDCAPVVELELWGQFSPGRRGQVNAERLTRLPKALTQRLQAARVAAQRSWVNFGWLDCNLVSCGQMSPISKESEIGFGSQSSRRSRSSVPF